MDKNNCFKEGTTPSKFIYITPEKTSYKNLKHLKIELIEANKDYAILKASNKFLEIYYLIIKDEILFKVKPFEKKTHCVKFGLKFSAKNVFKINKLKIAKAFNLKIDRVAKINPIDGEKFKKKYKIDILLFKYLKDMRKVFLLKEIMNKYFMII